MEAKGVPKERILVAYQPRAKGEQLTEYSYKIDFVSTDDFFETIEYEVNKGNRFFLSSHFLFVIQVEDSEENEVSLLIADSAASKYKYSRVTSNDSSRVNRDYEFFGSGESSGIVGVNYIHKNSGMMNLYQSNSEGTVFSQFRQFVVNRPNETNFYEYAYNSAFFAVNSFEKYFIKKYSKELVQEMRGIKAKKHIHELNKKVKTLFSLSNGANWFRLNPPKTDHKDNSYSCEGKCYLNLHLGPEDVPGILSTKTGEGVLVGNGTVSEYLESTEIGLFLSTDSGISWIQLDEGIQVYNLGNFGNILLFCPFNQETDSLKYTLDYGKTVETVKLDRKIKVTQILTKRGNSDVSFLITGKYKNDDLVLSLDFNALNLPICKEESIELAKYKNQQGKDCVIGKKIEFTRRKTEEKCFLEENWISRRRTETCRCTAADYECDFGYKRISENGPCQSNKEREPEVPTKCFKYFEVSRGYRKAPGNSCAGSTEFDPLMVPCPEEKSLALLYSLLALIAICVFFIGFLCSLRKKPVPVKPSRPNYLSVDQED